MLTLKKNIVITLDKTCDIHYFKLKTLSQSEHGFDLSVQGISFAMVMPFSNEISLTGSFGGKRCLISGMTVYMTIM